MTGCLIKDLMLIKNQKQFLVIIGVIGLMMLIIYDNPSFVFGYLTVMLSFLPITTLAYDDAENGAAYLFSLPVTRKGYVAEKYLFSIGFTLVTGSVVYGVVWVGCLLKRYSIQAEEMGMLLLASLSISVLFLATAIPVQIRFGSERSRIAGAIVMCSLFVICYGGARLLGALSIDEETLERAAASIGTAGIAGLAITAWIVIYGISCLVSFRLIAKREF